jgi:hypothetical protein
MTATRTLMLVATTSLLFACGAMLDGGASGQPCTPVNCKIEVKVAGQCSSPADITVDRDVLPVPRGNHQQKIEWRIGTPGFTFAAAGAGITFTTPPLPPSGEFSNPHSNGQKYDITDENSATTPTDYKYNIQLLRADGSPCARKDPVIKNGA